MQREQKLLTRYAWNRGRVCRRDEPLSRTIEVHKNQDKWSVKSKEVRNK